MELKPCPFCGKTDALKVMSDEEINEELDEYLSTPTQYTVICDAIRPDGPGGCGAQCGFSDTKEQAADTWNRRAESEAVDE